MVDGHRVLAIIAARGGSKGLPRKNVSSCAGRPLIQWSVLAAKGAGSVDRVIASSDDEEILEAARVAGAETPFVRPASLATDVAPMSEVVLHALDAVGERFEYAVLLQATSPLRTSSDIDDAFALLRERRAFSVVSVTPVGKSPRWMFHLDESGGLRPILPDQELATRRQELPPCYVLNGAVYAFSVSWFQSTKTFFAKETLAFVMPPERSIDIDSAMDFTLADALLRARSGVDAP